MGVPKFFRYITERYPCLSEIVKEYQIPAFDNLYLDMNGIIHNCSHPDDDDPHFRISEEKIFQDIFHYIEVLFRMIKPQKLFFMAIDGVAPRAKMNQQRARRFRSAKDAEKMIEKAVKKGEILPMDDRFDSNCITPGTSFMIKLQQQLKYFVVDKISNDKLWQKCKIILSGHETPGEGEHKIMDYIRYIRAQPGYDPNTRHCLYGLDADLIMLGLCTHEPHFSLLREEVKFGRKANRKRSAPEEITFYLLHLSLMREYLGLEFKDLETSNQLAFKYDIEKIIDDWVLMGFLVGNDFIPHLPYLHIGEGAIPALYKTYMKVLPTFDGYLNESGTLNLPRFEKFLEALAEVEFEHFSDQCADLKYFEAKTGRKFGTRGKLEEWEDDGDVVEFEALEPTKPINSELAALIKNTDDMFSDPNDLNLDNLEIDERSDSSDRDLEMIQMEFTQHKTDYYRNKLEYPNVTAEVLQAQAHGYVRAIQWNLNYYYNGCCSWSWYYPHHYAPYISDIKGFSDLKIEFDLGKPFKPYEQLLAVLPPLSKKLLPSAYHKLMTDENSMLKDFYPNDFMTDLNGKKHDWEAVVLIPFINEVLLLEAMKPCNLELTPEEIEGNKEGPMLIYQFSKTDQGPYPAPEYFPTIPNNFTICTKLSIDDIRVPKDKLIKGAYPGVKQEIYFPGFPTTKHLEYTHHVANIKVKVHEQSSRNESMILTLKVNYDVPPLEEVAKDLLGKTVYVAWPHLVEALVVSVSNKNFRYHHTKEPGNFNIVENKGNVAKDWQLESSTISDRYKSRFGIEVGPVSILVHVKVMIGRKYMFTQAGRVTLEKQWAPITSPYPLQSIVKEILVNDDVHSAFRDIESLFPVGSLCFMLSHPCYGSCGTVKDSKDCIKNGRLKICMKSYDEPNLDDIQILETQMRTKYMNSHDASTRIAISKILFSRITGSILISTVPRFQTTDESSKVNVGLNLKFSKRNEEIPGYTRKDGNFWYYSEKAVELVKQFKELFPEVFSYVNLHNENVYYLEDIYPEGDGKEKVAAIVKWIKSQEYYSFERRSCGSCVLEPEVIKCLEKTIDEYVKTAKPKITNMQVKPHVLYKPDLFVGNVPPDQNTKFQLYDRVVNVRESYTVPFGLEGTIIAVHDIGSGNDLDKVYDVLFDKPFAGGLQLNCSPNRGYRLPRSALINKSHGRRIYEQKCGTVQQIPKQHQQQPIQDTQQKYFYPQYYPQSNPLRPIYNIPPPAVPYVFKNQNRGAPFYNVQPNFTQNVPVGVSQNEMFTQQRSFHGVQILSKSKPKQNNPASSEKGPKENSTEKVNDNHTDLLKQMLKIDNSPKQCVNNQSISIDDIFQQHKKVAQPQPHQKATRPQQSQESKPPLKQPQNIPAVEKFNTVQLLEYLQMHGLGVPHYNYLDLPNAKVQAQLIHPTTGNLVVGTPSNDKQSACESVAGEVLKLISGPGKPLPPQIPQPPKTWTAQNKNPSSKSSTPSKKSQSSQELGGKRNSASAFVPLQAVRKHIAKNVTPPKENVENKEGLKKGEKNKHAKEEKVGVTGVDMQNVPTKSVEPVVSQKPMRNRKMRLAANFDMKPSI
ncbi:5'-3' exoribonuclease 1 isoform X2 [Onthophagus taurus]|uniref:5'-3' exoribonuclease 1 isoform X2 n=1 Tax=Onthophagus taurus TaxID=166361 RepID=UPI0039BE1FEC